MDTQMDAEALEAFFDREFPESRSLGFRVARVDDAGVALELPFREKMLRPGGTVSGPTLMALADTVAYALILSRIGPVGLAVTTSLTIQFLRKPPAAALTAEGELLKLGKRLAVADVRIFSADVEGGPVAQATVTYSIPPR